MNKIHRLDGLDIMRGVAAMMIVLFHIAHMNKVGLTDSLTLIKTHFGYGVPFFYAISAFSLYYGYYDKFTSFITPLTNNLKS